MNLINTGKVKNLSYDYKIIFRIGERAMNSKRLFCSCKTGNKSWLSGIIIQYLYLV